MNNRLETEFTLDPTQDDGIDDLNDDTFGDGGSLADDWEYQQQEAAFKLQQQKGLPSFFGEDKGGKEELPDFF